MKKTILIFFITIYNCFAQVGIGTITPNAQLDINSTRHGVLIPRIALTSLDISAPVVNPQGTALVSGTLIYNTATAGTSPKNVLPGFYYWDATNSIWIALAGSGGKNWSLTGNSGTNATTNFIGTTDAIDFVTKTNNIERTRITSSGSFGVGIATPNSAKMHIFEQTGTTVTASNGTLILDHGNAFGNSSILFKSSVNSGDDYGFIRYSDDGSGNGSSIENSLLEIGVGNEDATSPSQDDIAIMPSGYLGIGTKKPNAKLHNNGTTAFTTATSGTSNTVILQDAGTFFTPTPNSNNSGVVYIIRNTSTTTDLIVEKILDFASTTVADFTLTPSIGVVMIVCNGTNWYRIK